MIKSRAAVAFEAKKPLEIVEVDVAGEQPLVEDVAERIHGVVGAAVLAADPELRQEGGPGGANVGLRLSGRGAALLPLFAGDQVGID